MNVTQLIERTRDILKERPTQSQESLEWQDAEVLRCLNAANDQLWHRARLIDEDWGVGSTLLSAFNPVEEDVDSRWLRITLDRDLPTIKAMYEKTTAGSQSWCEVYKQNIRDETDTIGSHVRHASGGRGFFLGKNARELWLTKSNRSFDATELRIFFVRKPPNMIRFLTPGTPSTTTLTVPVTTAPSLGLWIAQPDYYAGAFVECISMPSAATPQGLKFSIGSFLPATHPTWTLTLETAHGLAPSPATPHTWEITPIWPDEHHELLAILAASRALLGGSSAVERAEIGKEAAFEMAAFINNVQSRQIQLPRSVFWEPLGTN